MTDPIRTAIIEARDKRGVSQTELARAAGMRLPDLSNALAGRRPIPYQALLKICARLGLELRSCTARSTTSVRSY